MLKKKTTFCQRGKLAIRSVVCFRLSVWFVAHIISLQPTSLSGRNVQCVGQIGNSERKHATEKRAVYRLRHPTVGRQ